MQHVAPSARSSRGLRRLPVDAWQTHISTCMGLHALCSWHTCMVCRQTMGKADPVPDARRLPMLAPALARRTLQHRAVHAVHPHSRCCCGPPIPASLQVICMDNFFTGSKDNIAHLLDKENFELIRHDVRPARRRRAGPRRTLAPVCRGSGSPRACGRSKRCPPLPPRPAPRWWSPSCWRLTRSTTWPAPPLPCTTSEPTRCRRCARAWRACRRCWASHCGRWQRGGARQPRSRAVHRQHLRHELAAAGWQLEWQGERASKWESWAAARAHTPPPGTTPSRRSRRRSSAP